MSDSFTISTVETGIDDILSDVRKRVGIEDHNDSLDDIFTDLIYRYAEDADTVNESNWMGSAVKDAVDAYLDDAAALAYEARGPVWTERCDND